MTPEQSAAIARIRICIDPKKNWHVTADEARLLLSALEEAQAVRADWHLIETAPKTGYIIGAWQDGKWVSAQIWWDDNVEVWVHATGDDYVRPTHWMPLPDALTPGDKP